MGVLIAGALVLHVVHVRPSVDVGAIEQALSDRLERFLRSGDGRPSDRASQPAVRHSLRVSRRIDGMVFRLGRPADIQ